MVILICLANIFFTNCLTRSPLLCHPDWQNWNVNDMPHRLGYLEDTPRLIKVRVPQGAVSEFKGK